MKVLVTSDIHIDDYRLYNVSHRSRLNQFYTLMDQIKLLKDRLNSEYIVIAGDIINKPVNPPHVNRVLMDFLDFLSKEFKDVYVILGQHDLWLRGGQDWTSSLVTLLSSWKDNIHYVNGEYIQFEDRTAFFSDYSFKKSVIAPDRHVDAFFSHVTLPLGMIKGQEIDESNFDLGMFGDIHAHVDLGKLHSIGTPVQVGRTETQTHTIGVWDTDSNTFERVPIYGLPKILPTNDRDQVGPNEELNTYFYYKDNSVRVTESEEIKIDTELDIHQLISDAVRSLNLDDIHSDVVSRSNYIPIDFSFTPIELEVHNIRSCKYFKYNFKEGITYIHGTVGSGKSTVINCILDALVGVNLKDRITYGESEASNSLTLGYGGHIYKIVRHSHQMDQFFVDGNEVRANSGRSIDQEINESLPFIQYADSFFFGAWQREILGDLKPKRRVELLSKYYQLDLTQEYLNVASVNRDQLKNQVKLTEVNLRDLDVELRSYQSQSSEIENQISNGINLTESESLNRIDQLTQSLSQYEKNQRLKSDIEKIKISRESTLRSIDNLTIDRVKLDQINSEIEVLEGKRGEMEQIKRDYDVYFQEKSKLEWQLQVNKESSSSKICPTCKRPFDQEHQEDHTQKVAELESRLANLTVPDIEMFYRWQRVLDSKSSESRTLSQSVNRLNQLGKELEKLDQSIESIEIDEINLDPIQVANELSVLRLWIDLLHRRKASLDKVQTLTVERDKIQSDLNELNSQLEKWEKYIEVLQFDGPIVTSILEKLTDRMSNEQFKFKTLSYKKNGKSVADLSVMFNNSGHWTTYEDCSTGQRCLCDTYFISKLITYSGMVMFDEFFSNVDDMTLDPLFEIIRSINSKYIVICSHSNNVTDIDHRIRVTLDENGISQYECT